jgi:hypothetical protein
MQLGELEPNTIKTTWDILGDLNINLNDPSMNSDFMHTLSVTYQNF